MEIHSSWRFHPAERKVEHLEGLTPKTERLGTFLRMRLSQNKNNAPTQSPNQISQHGVVGAFHCCTRGNSVAINVEAPHKGNTKACE